MVSLFNIVLCIGCRLPRVEDRFLQVPIEVGCNVEGVSFTSLSSQFHSMCGPNDETSSSLFHYLEGNKGLPYATVFLLGIVFLADGRLCLAASRATVPQSLLSCLSFFPPPNSRSSTPSILHRRYPFLPSANITRCSDSLLKNRTKSES